MNDAQPAPIYLKDYTAPAFTIVSCDLNFDLYDDHTRVSATLSLSRMAGDSKEPLVLQGQALELIELCLNGERLAEEQYQVSEEQLTIADVPAQFELTCVTRIKPHLNTSLEGLYQSNTMYCTQCEAEGFRKITYYLDRPDVMSEFSVRITADQAQFPVLLSNGNKTGEGKLEDGRHWVSWHDPHRKPCYLFALVAGDLVAIDDHFTTQSGREVLLRIFVEEKDNNKCSHAMTSLKNAMRWDEQVYGREYDLDIFMIVAVDDFNMGAMENKGLNIFNTSCVLASPETTTDESFQSVEGVVAHEYFHNWSGNRVTCRDWFQLSLKEGFTVFRDSEFSADMGSRTVKRVEDVNVLRTHQFAEDGGPMAHPVQPSSFIEISNFYTLTVYEKGAEIVRMIHSLLGPETFRKGSDLYFERHDGCAVTIDDFVQAMSEVSGRDFTQFMHWYRQAGTPVVSVEGVYDDSAQRYTLRVSQHCPPTPESQSKKPFHIPLAIGLLGSDGPMLLKGENIPTVTPTHAVLEITQEQQSFTFEEVHEAPVPSLFRNFSAPVKLKIDYSLTDFQRLIANDEDGFCRWDATQQMALQVIKDVMIKLGTDPAPRVAPELLAAHSALLSQATAVVEGGLEQDLKMLAYALILPSEEYLAETQTIVDVESTHYARQRVKRKLAQEFYDEYLHLYQALSGPKAFAVDAQSIAQRKLKNTALGYLMASGKDDATELCLQQFERANNMTDELSALTELVHSARSSTDGIKKDCLEKFHQKWKNEALVLNRWFSVQATVPRPGTLKQVEILMGHPAFDAGNPNKIRSLIGAFASRNAICFHDRTGKGYQFLADRVLDLNEKNPQIASRLLTPLTRWKKYDAQRQDAMKKALNRIRVTEGLSKDVYEVVTKSI